MGWMVELSYTKTMRLLAVISVIVATVGCSKIMNLDEAATRLSHLAGKPIRPFATYDFGRGQDPAARSVVVPENDARKLVDQLRNEIGPGLVVFIGCTRSLATPPVHGSEVVVAAGAGQFDILRVAQSDAVNYDMDTEDLIRKLREYDSDFGIDIFHAETDTIEFTLRTPPADLAALAADLYEFCPDIVDQGVGTVKKLEQELARTKTVYLWWD